MKSTDLITREFINSHDACLSGENWFVQNFPNGGEYQKVLDALVEQDHTDWASWLMSIAGASDEVREIEGDLKAKSYYFCGSLRVSGLISVELRLQAGSGIKAGSGIEAGSDYGIFAALRLRLSLWAEQGRVIAKEQPKNLKTGVYVPLEPVPVDADPIAMGR